MRLFFTIFLSIIVTTSLWAQDIMINDFNGEIITSYQKSSTKIFKIQNFSDSPKTIKVKQNIDKIQGGSTFIICYNDDCNKDGEPLILNIPANSTSNDLKVTLNGGLSYLNTIAYIEFIDMEVDKVVKKEISLKVTEEKAKDIFYEKGEITVNSFFPNPAIKNAIMEYSINPYETEAKITIQNVLGSIVSTYDLSPDENKLNISTENLNPGVYFYTLFVKDEGLATRKLIVKK